MGDLDTGRIDAGATPSDPGPQCAAYEPSASERIADAVRELERKLRVTERLLDLERDRVTDLTRERDAAQAEAYRLQRGLGF